MTTELRTETRRLSTIGFRVFRRRAERALTYLVGIGTAPGDGPCPSPSSSSFQHNRSMISIDGFILRFSLQWIWCRTIWWQVDSRVGIVCVFDLRLFVCIASRLRYLLPWWLIVVLRVRELDRPRVYWSPCWPSCFPLISSFVSWTSRHQQQQQPIDRLDPYCLSRLTLGKIEDFQCINNRSWPPFLSWWPCWTCNRVRSTSVDVRVNSKKKIFFINRKLTFNRQSSRLKI